MTARSVAKRARTRIGVGIYRDAYGLAATVKAGGVQREKRFPPDTSVKTMKAWQGETRVALRKLNPRAGRGTFAADVDRYLEGRTTMPTYAGRKVHLALWSAEFGQRSRRHDRHHRRRRGAQSVARCGLRAVDRAEPPNGAAGALDRPGWQEGPQPGPRSADAHVADARGPRRALQDDPKDPCRDAGRGPGENRRGPRRRIEDEDPAGADWY